MQIHNLLKQFGKTLHQHNSIIRPCPGMHLSSVSGSKILSMGQGTLDLNLGKLKLKHTFIAGKNLTRQLILGIDYHHMFMIGTDWDGNGILFLHKNAHIISHSIRLSQTFPKVESAMYQEIPPYIIAVIKKNYKRQE